MLLTGGLRSNTLVVVTLSQCLALAPTLPRAAKASERSIQRSRNDAQHCNWLPVGVDREGLLEPRF